MSLFEYTAETVTGETVAGRLEADSAEELRWSLVNRGLAPQAVRESDAGARSDSSGPEILSPRSVHIELTLRQIAVMLRSGLTLLAAIETVIEQPPSRPVRRVYEEVRRSLESGSSFAEALREHKCFKTNVISMVGMGEESGNLDTVIERAADTMESKRRNQAATITA
ncbi:MAG: type II secretion system F family protein, partial [Verrucomicrobiota bacterium]